MRQRLALAGAVLGNPQALVLDEPATGLDPAGMAWMRRLLTDWAAAGRTVLFSSHVLAEVEMVAERVVIIYRGRVVHEGTTADLSGSEGTVVVRTPDPGQFDQLAATAGWSIRRDGRDRLFVHGASADEIGQAAAREGVVLSELSTEPRTRQLEDLFLALTNGGAGVPQ